MKTLRLMMWGMSMSLIVFTSCQHDSITEDVIVAPQNDAVMAAVQTEAAGKAANNGNCNPNAYVVTLESRTQTGNNWEWVWSVYNPNPGNGNNGTAQALSHWGMQLGSCVNLSAIVDAGYSSDGVNWTSFSPSYQADPSQQCMTTPVIKFDFGTSGATKSYYRLIVNTDYAEGFVPAYYKSGNRTGCCTFEFIGIGGCDGPVEIEIVE